MTDLMEWEEPEPSIEEPRVPMALPMILGFGAFWCAVALPEPERKKT